MLYSFPLAAWCQVLGSGWTGSECWGCAALEHRGAGCRWVGALGAAQTKRGGRFPAAASSNCHDNQQADYSITAFLWKSDIKPRDNTSSASHGAWFSKHRAMFNFLMYLVIMFANLVLDLFFFIIVIIILFPCSLKCWESKKLLEMYSFSCCRKTCSCNQHPV